MDSLLNASRLFDGEIAYHPVEFAPAELLRDVCQLHRDTTRSADIHEEFSALPAIVTGDPKLLFAAIGNLLSNALKYSLPGSPIQVSARGEGSEHWLVSVRDHGIGIAERDRGHLFERFFRGTNVARVAGNGVGLHLVSMVLALHGGTIEVVSREGEGSTFKMLLPLRVPASEAGSGVKRPS
jgi:signal transduction histidine kinase